MGLETCKKYLFLDLQPPADVAKNSEDLCELVDVT